MFELANIEKKLRGYSLLKAFYVLQHKAENFKKIPFENFQNLELKISKLKLKISGNSKIENFQNLNRVDISSLLRPVIFGQQNAYKFQESSKYSHLILLIYVLRQHNTCIISCFPNIFKLFQFLFLFIILSVIIDVIFILFTIIIYNFNS